MPDKKTDKNNNSTISKEEKDIINNYLNKIKQAESGNNPNAKSNTSTATGLFQFTKATWSEMEKQLGKKLDIFNPKDQEIAARRLTEINIKALKDNNLPVTEANLYTTHFLGKTGGTKFLKNLQKNPNESAIKFASDSAVNANKNLFYKDNKALSAAELYNNISSKVNVENKPQIQSNLIQPNLIPETDLEVRDNTNIDNPSIDPVFKPSKTLKLTKDLSNQNQNNNPIENTRKSLGLTNNLDFLPKDINLVFSEEEQLQNDLENENINPAKYGGNMNNNKNNKINKSDKTLSSGLLNEFNEGDSHEKNSYGGIPQGVGQNGKLNTVEEGETKFNNYVFSDTLKVSEDDAENLFLPKKIANKTFAEASKYINKILEDNPNDRIIKKTVQKQLDALTLGNEKARLAKEQLDSNLNNNLTLSEPIQEVSDLEVPDTDQMFLGGDIKDEKTGLTGYQSAEIMGGLGMLGGFAQGDITKGISSGVGAAVNTFVPGAGAFVSPIIDSIGNLFDGDNGPSDRDIRRKNITNSSQFSSDFNMGDMIKNKTKKNCYETGGLIDDDYLKSLDDLDAIEKLKNYSANDPNYLDTDNNIYNPNDITPINITPYQLNNSTNNYSNPNIAPTDNTYKPLGKDKMQYAPVLGDFLNYLDANKATAEKESLNRISTRFQPKYIDERSVQNNISNDFDNVINGLTNASNGSEGALRNNIIAAGSQKTRNLSDAYFKVNESNNNQDLQGQQFNLNIDQFNVGQSNLEKDINAKNRAIVEDRKNLSRDSIFKDLGAIGRENTYENRLSNLTGGYDSSGKYNPDRQDVFSDILGFAKKNLRKDNNDPDYESGGFLSNILKVTDKDSRRKLMETEFNNRYK